MKFSEILDGLKEGHIYTNGTMKEKNQCIVCHIPQNVPADVVPKMTSIPQTAKRLMTDCSIAFRNQVLILEWDRENGGNYLATGYTPSWDDIFRDDWEFV